MKKDEDLIAMFLGGSAQAFTGLVRRYERMVYNTAFSMVGDRESARDITQEAFLRTLKGLACLKNPHSFRPWLLQITSNLAKDSLRRKRDEIDSVDPEEDSPSHEREAFQVLSSLQEKERVRGALNLLPDRQRMAIVLRVYNELSFKEVALAMGCQPATARSLFWAGVKRLRKILGGRP